MKIEWTPDGGSSVTLGDDSVKHTVLIEGWSGLSMEQVDAIFRGANVSRTPRGNVGGTFTFSSAKSEASRSLAMSGFVSAYARLNQKGSLMLTDGLIVTMDNAILRGVECVSPLGVRWTIRYTFGITTVEQVAP